MKLDKFDKLLLNALQHDGRLTSQELAEKCSLSSSQCARRRQRLEEEGIIKNYQARLSKRSLGLGISVFVHISLTNHDSEEIASFMALIDTNPNILEACKLTGNTDFLLRVVTHDLDELNCLINEVVLPHPAVAHMRSQIVLEWLKEDGVLPVSIG